METGTRNGEAGNLLTRNNGACRCRWTGRDHHDSSSSRLKSSPPANHEFSDSLVLVVEPLVFLAVCICWPDPIQPPAGRLRSAQTQRFNGSAPVCFFLRNHTAICRENTKRRADSCRLLAYARWAWSSPADYLLSGRLARVMLFIHRDGHPPRQRG